MTHDLNFPEITRPYLRHGKNRRGTFYSVSSVKKISSLLRSLCASKRVDLTRRLDSRNSLPFSASFAVDFIRHCETRCNAAGCPFSLSLSLSAFFYSAHRLDREPMQTRKLDRILGIITSSGKCRRSTSFIYRRYTRRAKSGPTVLDCNKLHIRIFIEILRNYLINFSHICIRNIMSFLI